MLERIAYALKILRYGEEAFDTQILLEQRELIWKQEELIAALKVNRELRIEREALLLSVIEAHKAAEAKYMKVSVLRSLN